MGWRPIESVPLDGTAVLLWDKYEDVPMVARRISGSWSADKSFVGAEGGWDGANVVDMIDEQFITHWMPLPAPPEDT